MAVSLVCLFFFFFKIIFCFFSPQRTFISLINLTKFQIQFKIFSSSWPSHLSPSMAPFGSGKVVQDQSFIFCSAISYLLFASSKFGIAAHFNNGVSHEHLESPPTLNISPCNFLDTSQNLCSAWTLPFPSYPVDSFRNLLVVMPSRGPSKQNSRLAQTPKTSMASGKGFQRQCEGGGCSRCDQLMHNSQIGWHQGKVSSISSLLVSTSLGLCSCGQQFPSRGWVLPVKTT